ncbi:hypothetical protein BG74_05570 [Sodalis-like endosymbiont of Proechinophthirus fluctus]|nr:hypothetical protein BG74_05570 [Sodalis-like endosymbiont of Proechinophthirus fluctus]
MLGRDITVTGNVRRGNRIMAQQGGSTSAIGKRSALRIGIGQYICPLPLQFNANGKIIAEITSLIVRHTRMSGTPMKGDTLNHIPVLSDEAMRGYPQLPDRGYVRIVRGIQACR